MNIAIIFAGGTGTRMNSRSKPKQFLEVHGKPGVCQEFCVNRFNKQHRIAA
jgi:2-C-methyl-D-erythritol 4-phosphate cytidylyltransferase